jgi:hypothetical protein
MSRRVIGGDWPQTPSEHAVKAWLDKIGIDSTSVVGYEIKARVNDLSTIKLELHFTEDKVVPPGQAGAGLPIEKEE